MIRVRVQFVGGLGGPYLSTHYFITGGDATQTEVQAAVNATGVFWAAVDNVISSTLAWNTETEVVEMNPLGVIQNVFSSTPASGQGSGGTTGPPTFTQGLLRWNTSLFIAGRRLRGRTFIPGVQNAHLAGNGILATHRNTVDAAAAALIADTNTSFAIWSRKHATLANATTGTESAVAAVLRSRRD